MSSRADTGAPHDPRSWALRWAAWWVALMGIWLAVLLDSVKPAVLAAGAVAAAVAATAVRVVSAQRLVTIAPDLRLLRHAWRPLVRSVPDTALLAAALWRRLVLRRPVQGTFRQLRFRAAGDDAHATARRVLAKSLGSFAPNTYVIGFDEDREALLLHQLVRTEGTRDLDPLGLR